MSQTIGIGIIGMGWMGNVHARCYGQVNDRFPDLSLKPRLVICADEVEARAREGKERFGFERSTAEWQQVVADPEVEALDITTPNNLHLEIVRAAAAAGKHIYCEKPVGRSPEETAEIEHAARQAAVKTFVGYNYRWAPLVQHARKLIEKGELGKLTHYRGRFFVGYASNPHGVLSWRFRRDLAGLGCLGDLMSHVVDMARMIAGPIRRVVGNRETFIPKRPLPAPGEGTHFSARKDGPLGEVTNEDYVGALAQFSNGAHGTLEACRVINGPQCQMAFEANATRGAVSWDFERMNELRLFLSGEHRANEGFQRILTAPEHPFHAQFNPGPAVGLGYEDLKIIEAYQFLKAIAENRQAEPGFREARQVAEVLAAIERSWQTQRWEEVRAI